MGTRLGRYEIIRTLAKGSLTDLLLGRASGMEGFERHVAIKRLHAEPAKDASVLEMFINEARLVAALHHHNIVQVLDIGDAAGEPFFAMEYVHGVDLRTLLKQLATRNEQIPIPHVVSIVASAAAALHHAHDAKAPDGKPLGIVHRQVTPGNILVGYDGNVKIVDFGIAKAAIKRSDTGVGVLRGFAPYMAPEQCAGQNVDRRSDIFALGIVLFELTTVRRLFKGANEFLTMSAVVNAEVPRPSQYRRDIPSELEVVMLKALSRDPLGRFQTAGDMAEALDRVARQVGVGASTTQLANYMKLQFGEQREPWLEKDDESDDESDRTVTDVDFDGAVSGVAPPPSEAKNFEIPKTIETAKGSLIQRARTVAATPAPPPTVPAALPKPRAKSPVAAYKAPDGFGVATSVDGPSRAKTVEPIGDEILKLAESTKTATAVEPPAVVETERKRAVEMTEVVEPLSILTARAQTMQAARRRPLLWVAIGLLAVVAVVIAIVVWPSSSVDPAAATSAQAAPPAEKEPAKPEEKSALDMTARDYEKARGEAEPDKQAEPGDKQAATGDKPGASADKAAEPADKAAEPADKAAEPADKAAEPADKAAEPAAIAQTPTPPADQVAHKPIQVAEKPAADKPAVRPATKPAKRTTTAKPAAKRAPATPTKKPAKKSAKPKWNPDDLFLGE